MHNKQLHKSRRATMLAKVEALKRAKAANNANAPINKAGLAAVAAAQS
jgi:hypothetical protein